MKAHIIENGIVVNTIEVENLEVIPGLISAETGMIGDRYENGNFISDVVALDVVKVVPQKVTMRQAKLALHQQGLLATVDATIAGGSDEILKIEWEYATEVDRDWDRLNTLVNALGLTAEAVDDLFILAQTL